MIFIYTCLWYKINFGNIKKIKNCTFKEQLLNIKNDLKELKMNSFLYIEYFSSIFILRKKIFGLNSSQNVKEF